MVLQIGTHLGRIDPHRNTLRAQYRWGANARQLQNLRRLQSTCCQQDFAIGAGLFQLARLQPLHTHRAAMQQQDLGDLGPGDHGQVGAAQRWAQKCGRGIAAPVPAQGQLVAAHAVGLGAIEIIGSGMASLRCGVQPGFAIRMVVAQIGYAQFTGIAVEGARAAFVALRAFEVRQHLLVAPALGPQGRPVVVVRMLTSDIQQSVDGTGATQHLSTRPHHAPFHGVGLRLYGKLPRKTLVQNGAKVAHRQAQPKTLRGAAGLQEQNPAGRVCAEPVGQNATGRAGTDDDVIKTLGCVGAVHGVVAGRWKKTARKSG